MSTSGRIAQGVTLLITWAIKIAGLVAACIQLIGHADHPSSLALGVAAFMLAGAQFSESALLALIDRVTGQHSTPEPEPPKPKARVASRKDRK